MSLDELLCRDKEVILGAQGQKSQLPNLAEPSLMLNASKVLSIQETKIFRPNISYIFFFMSNNISLHYLLVLLSGTDLDK